MRVGAIATYPGRAEVLEPTVRSIAPQLDRLSIVFNEYAAVPDWVADLPNVEPVLPPSDTKDTGKYFVPAPAGSWLFTLDDDIAYPPDYVARTLAGWHCAAARLGTERVMVGYLGWNFRKARLFPSRWMRRIIRYNPNYIARSWNTVDFRCPLERAMIVEALGTGVALMRAEDAPAFADVRDAQKFTDVRLGLWCHRHGIVQVCLPRPEGYLRDVAETVPGGSIYQDFTLKGDARAAEEMWRFAFRNRRRGETLEFGFADMAGPERTATQ